MSESPESVPTDWSGDDDPNRRALVSVDAVHDADPANLNEEVARLRQLIRFRRPLYYSILAPFGQLSRFSPLLVLVSSAAAVIGAVIAILAGSSSLIIGLLWYWGLGGLGYHALSVRLAMLLSDAARSVGLRSADVLEAWKAD
jgi:hypothetical protein